jgi:hypothetical protein
MNMKKVAVVVAIIFGLTALQAETRLSGEIQSTSFDASGNPYIVEKDILVPSGKKLAIKEGCVFLFSGFSGLNVSGSISVEGTEHKPVIFTCINDNEFNSKSQQLPNPFDWNGIIVSKESGSVHFQNFQLRYSVYGIKSQNTKMTLQNGLFRQNGQFHFTMNDKIQYVQDNISYSFNASPDSEKTVDTSGHGGSNPKTGPSATRNIIRYSSLGIGVMGIVAGTIFAMQASSASKDLDYFGTHPINDPVEGLARYNQLNDKLKSQNTLMAVFFSLGGLGLLGFTATFIF